MTVAGREAREVIAELLQSWQGDDAGVFGMADQLVNKLRAEGYVVTDANECKVCGEDIDAFCIRHGFDGGGVPFYLAEAAREGYVPLVDLLTALGVPCRTGSDGTIITLVTELRPKEPS